MNHLSVGELRSHLDQESPAVAEHLRACAVCAGSMDELKRTSERVSALLSGDGNTPDTSDAYGRFVARHGHVGIRSPFVKPAWVGAFACGMLVLLLAFSPVRIWGQRILSMLRVQKVAVLPLDLEALSAATNGHEKLLAQMISDRAVVTMKPGEPSKVEDAGSASSAAGYQVRTIENLGAPTRIQVRDEAAFQIQLDRDRMLALLDAVGRSDIALPDNLDGSIIAAHIPKSVEMDYGSCAGKRGADSCIHFMQLPSPVVSVPPSLNISALAESALQLTGMSAAEAQAFSRSVDWSSTFVLPIPMHNTSSRVVPVDGVDGTLVESAAQGRHPQEYALIWVNKGRVYAISGTGPADKALAVAESLN